jgi:hypothetical protein
VSSEKIVDIMRKNISDTKKVVKILLFWGGGGGIEIIVSL